MTEKYYGTDRDDCENIPITQKDLAKVLETEGSAIKMGRNGNCVRARPVGNSTKWKWIIADYRGIPILLADNAVFLDSVVMTPLSGGNYVLELNGRHGDDGIARLIGLTPPARLRGGVADASIRLLSFDGLVPGELIPNPTGSDDAISVPAGDMLIMLGGADLIEFGKPASVPQGTSTRDTTLLPVKEIAGESLPDREVIDVCRGRRMGEDSVSKSKTVNRQSVTNTSGDMGAFAFIGIVLFILLMMMLFKRK